jgi:hypothetical protein
MLIHRRAGGPLRASLRSGFFEAEKRQSLKKNQALRVPGAISYIPALSFLRALRLTSLYHNTITSVKSSNRLTEEQIQKKRELEECVYITSFESNPGNGDKKD